MTARFVYLRQRLKIFREAQLSEKDDLSSYSPAFGVSDHPQNLNIHRNRSLLSFLSKKSQKRFLSLS
jgi:hypothetical protein